MVSDLHDFQVDDETCSVALLTISEILVLLEVRSPTALRLGLLAAEIELVTKYLADET